MRILYGIQGTGNGHISRARDIIPSLQRYGKVDILVSGTQADVTINHPITYRCKGMGFVFGKNGGVDLLQTFIQAKTKRFYDEIKSLPVAQYDLIISDFEPVTAWACYARNIDCVGLSHQSAVLAPNAPKPEKSDIMGHFILKNYAPVSQYYGFHFDSYADNIFTPVIRQQIRKQEVTNKGHFTVYLPSYDDAHLLKNLSGINNVEWQVFSKYNTKKFREGNVVISPIHNESFMASLASAEGLLCGAGFETPAEALYMKKRVMAIPMKNQFEQHCNAAALSTLGVPIIKSLKSKHIPEIADWVNNGKRISVNYPDITDKVIDLLVYNYTKQQSFSLSQFLALKSAI